jgi:hypothetical protein
MDSQEGSSSTQTLKPQEAMHAPPEFQYQPLDPTRNEIRLLKLSSLVWPDPEGCRVACKIVYAPFDNAPVYYALSYMWSDATTTKYIFVDGHYFNFTSNLEAALWPSLSVFGSLALWVDAICINQNDVDERSQQVDKMRSIYQHAREVHVYINNNEGIGNTALRLSHNFLLHIGDGATVRAIFADCSKVE